MKFGTHAKLQRKSLDPHKTEVGRGRFVPVRYLGARGNQVYCELLEDDQDATVMAHHKGDRGWWSRSCLFTLDG